MSTVPKGWKDVAGAVVRATIGIVGLLIVRAIVLGLPMIKEVPLIAYQIIDAGILTVVIGVILWFGLDMRAKLSQLLPSFTESGEIVLALAGLIAVVVAYVAYKGLLRSVLGELSWLYALVCLLLALGIVGILSISAYRNVDKVIALVTGKLEMVGAMPQVKPQAPVTTTSGCPKCGASCKEGDRFCGSCGSPLPEVKPAVIQPTQQAVAQQPEIKKEEVCPKCGTAYEPGDVFCGKCGASLQSM